VTDEAALLVMRFAFPCAEISVQLGHIFPEEYATIEKALLEQKALPRAEIERYWPALFKRLKEVAEKEGLDYWDSKNIRLHYLKYHDGYIDMGDGLLGKMSPTEKELCRARLGKVVRREKVGEELIFILENGERILGRYLPSVTEGTIIAYHRRFATDVLSEAAVAELQQK
jgi:hypothetical protein